MQASFDDIQQALIEDRITIFQLTEILVDNYGYERSVEIIKEIVDLAKKKGLLNENSGIIINNPPVFMCGPSFSFSSR